MPQAAELRTRLRDADATFRIVKNSLTERAADQAGAETLKVLLDGPTALTFVRGDAALAAKAMPTFRRETDRLAFKGGCSAPRRSTPSRSWPSRACLPATSSTASSSASWRRRSRAWSAR